MWDVAALKAQERIDAKPSTKELRDLVYILEHLKNMLPDSQQSSGKELEVIFAAGDESWNE